MSCPGLNELPPPPPGRTGWPWTEEPPPLPETPPGGQTWPRVSIVTPSYNQGEFIEETLRSVLLQGYPNLEYIILDGGSSDGSADIIRKYEPWLAYWVSEPDRGQADAINKGFARATGEIVAYLNSDDLYLPRALATAVSAFLADPELALVHGDLQLINSTGIVVGHNEGLRGDFLHYFLQLINPILQPSTFLRKSVLDDVGGIDPAFHMTMDYDLWCRIGLRGMKLQHISVDFSMFRIHPQSKTYTNTLGFAKERWQVVNNYLSDPVFGPNLARYKKRLLAAAHLHLAGAHWLCGDSSAAYGHYWDAIRRFPPLFFSRRSLSLLLRFVLGRRSFRARLSESH